MSRVPRRYAIRALLCLAAALVGCGGGGDRDPDVARPAAPLRIAAAADLQHVLPKLLEAYGDRDGPVAPPTFGASGNLTEQIRAGAPFDLFLSADEAFPTALEREGLLAAGSVRPYARGSLVLLVHPSIGTVVESLGDLVKPEVRKVAIANPEVAPYGKAARQALEKAGLWDALGTRIVPAGSVSQAFLHVEEGNADAALVSRSLVAGASSKRIDVDPSLYPPRTQGLGIVAESPNAERAERFVDYLLGPEGRRILGEAGFSPPSPSPSS